MVTVLASVLVGLALGGIGLFVAPKELRPARPWRVMGVALLGALPGALLGLVLIDDLLLDTHAMSLAASIVGATLAVLGAAFLPREKAEAGVIEGRTFAAKGSVLQVGEPGLLDCLAWLWRLRASRRARVPA